MDFWEKLSPTRLIETIEWADTTGNTLCYTFDYQNREIQYGASLVVREGQAAVFFNQGAVADIFPPGTYALNAQNLPLFSGQRAWPLGFDKPFAARVCFCSTRPFPGLKWGTPGPAILRGPENGATRVTAYGLCSFVVSNPALFLKECAAMDQAASRDTLANLRAKTGTWVKALLPELGMSVLEMKNNTSLLEAEIKKRLETSFAALGLSLNKVDVHDLGMQDELAKAANKSGPLKATGGFGGMARKPSEAGETNAEPDGKDETRAFEQAHESPPPLPPPPPIPSFWVALSGKEAGPFDGETLGKMIGAREILRTTLVWREGMEQWTPAIQILELAPFFAKIPPPLPPEALKT